MPHGLEIGGISVVSVDLVVSMYVLELLRMYVSACNYTAVAIATMGTKGGRVRSCSSSQPDVPETDEYSSSSGLRDIAPVLPPPERSWPASCSLFWLFFVLLLPSAVEVMVVAVVVVN